MTWFVEIFKDSPKGMAGDKTLCDKWSNIAKDRKYDGYKRDLVSMIYKFLDK